MRTIMPGSPFGAVHERCYTQNINVLLKLPEGQRGSWSIPE